MIDLIITYTLWLFAVASSGLWFISVKQPARFRTTADRVWIWATGLAAVFFGVLAWFS